MVSASNQHISAVNSPQVPKQDEHILVVKRSELFAQQPVWSGLKQVPFDTYLEIVQKKKEFLPRSEMEINPEYKQIIPYMIFHHAGRYFLMQRSAKATESRLQSKYSLGIGGHVREEDLVDGSLFSWAQREFHEEVEYTDAFTIEPLGILNDDSNPVGQVHIGFVLLVNGTTDAIKVKSELQSGQLVSLKEGKEYFNRMEGWSQIVFEFLLEHAAAHKERARVA
jgi:predicted NUDIX family phosphoesterase